MSLGRSRTLRIVAALVVGSVVLTAGGCGALDLKQREWIFRPQRDLPATPAEQGLKYEDIWLAVSEAVGGNPERIHGWWVPASVEMRLDSQPSGS